MPDLSAEGERDGFYQGQLIRELAVRHVTSWTGVELEGRPAPPTPENIAAVMKLYPVGERFLQEFTLRQVLLNTAKKRMRALCRWHFQPGGPNTAEPAVTTACPASEASPDARLFGRAELVPHRLERPEDFNDIALLELVSSAAPFSRRTAVIVRATSSGDASSRRTCASTRPSTPLAVIERTGQVSWPCDPPRGRRSSDRAVPPTRAWPYNVGTAASSFRVYSCCGLR